MASLTSWVDTRALAIIVDPFNAEAIYDKLNADPPEALTVDEEVWLAAVEAAGLQATWVIQSLMNAKVHPAETWEEDYVLHGRTLVLRQGPIDEIVSVEALDVCSGTTSPTSWCWPGDNSIQFESGGLTFGFGYFGDEMLGLGSCGQKRAVRVTYKTKDNLPPGALSNVTWLAEEHLKAATGQTCSLPERITSITRQGVSWTMLDPMDFLNSGLTGVGRIDSWLSTARRGHPSASMYDPYKSDRLRAELIPPPPPPEPSFGLFSINVNPDQGDPYAYNFGVDDAPYHKVDWDFGDGTSVQDCPSQDTVDHTYSESGEFVVTAICHKDTTDTVVAPGAGYGLGQYGMVQPYGGYQQ